MVKHYKHIFAWQLSSVRTYKKPLPYTHTRGAMSWVTVRDRMGPRVEQNILAVRHLVGQRALVLHYHIVVLALLVVHKRLWPRRKSIVFIEVLRASCVFFSNSFASPSIHLSSFMRVQTGFLSVTSSRWCIRWELSPICFIAMRLGFGSFHQENLEFRTCLTALCWDVWLVKRIKFEQHSRLIFNPQQRCY